MSTICQAWQAKTHFDIVLPVACWDKDRSMITAHLRALLLSFIVSTKTILSKPVAVQSGFPNLPRARKMLQTKHSLDIVLNGYIYKQLVNSAIIGHKCLSMRITGSGEYYQLTRFFCNDYQTHALMRLSVSSFLSGMGLSWVPFLRSHFLDKTQSSYRMWPTSAGKLSRSCVHLLMRFLWPLCSALQLRRVVAQPLYRPLAFLGHCLWEMGNGCLVTERRRLKTASISVHEHLSCSHLYISSGACSVKLRSFKRGRAGSKKIPHSTCH